MGKLDQALQFLRANNLFTCGAKEFLGSNIPHVLMVMNPAEMLEQGIAQFGNLAFQVPLTLALDKVLEATAGKLVRPGQPRALWHIGKSLALYSFVGGGIMAIPRIRNVVSMKRTGKTDFVGMVGLHQQAEDPDKVHAAIADNLIRLKQIATVTTALTVGFAAAGALASHRGLTLPTRLLTGLQKLTLPGGEYAKLRDVGAILSWGVPAYLGLWLGSRDKVEKQEVAIRAGAWGFAFTIIPRALERGLNRALEGRQFGPLGSGRNVAYAAQLALSVGLYTLVPTFVALVTRRDRARQAGLIPSAPVLAPSLPPVAPVPLAPPLMPNVSQPLTPNPFVQPLVNGPVYPRLTQPAIAQTGGSSYRVPPTVTLFIPPRPYARMAV